jgi:hypothetical protein
LNGVFGDDKRDAGLFVAGVMIWQLSYEQQSSENESLLTKYLAGVSAMHCCTREIFHHFEMKRLLSTISI